MTSQFHCLFRQYQTLTQIGPYGSTYRIFTKRQISVATTHTIGSISLCLKTHHWTTINLGIKLSLLTGPFWSGPPLSQPHHHHSALFLVRQEHRVLCHCRTLHVLCPPHILNLSPVLSHWIILTLYSGLQLKRHFFWDVFPDYSSPGFSSTKCVESLSSVLPEHPLQILLFASFDCLFP